MIAERRKHWDGVYRSKASTEVSWYQDVPDRSLELIKAAEHPLNDAIIDIGGGASTLVDHLLDAGYGDLTVLDLAETALDHSRERLGERADSVNWIVSDVVHFEPQRLYRLWHDRAVLQFPTDAKDRERYVDVLRRALVPGGHAVIATFGPAGPLKCSGSKFVATRSECWKNCWAQNLNSGPMNLRITARRWARHSSFCIPAGPGGGNNEY